MWAAILRSGAQANVPEASEWMSSPSGSATVNGNEEAESSAMWASLLRSTVSEAPESPMRVTIEFNEERGGVEYKGDDFLIVTVGITFKILLADESSPNRQGRRFRP